MFESQGFDESDYRYMKETVENAINRVKQFAELEIKLPPKGI